LTKIGGHVWIYTVNKLKTFHGNILSLNENIAKKFRRGLLFWLTCRSQLPQWKEAHYKY